MAKKPIIIADLITPDRLASSIADKYVQWETSRQEKLSEWEEVKRYIFATDTTKTANAQLPWSNKTTIPKLCQVRDNLYANYMASLFPKRKWLSWEGASREDETAKKKQSIELYMASVVDRPEFENTISRIVLDYIDYGNAFCMPEWKDDTHIQQDSDEPLLRRGYVGPVPRRISPDDIVFDPTVDSFEDTPKIIRSYISLGEVKEILERDIATEEDRIFAQELWDYLKGIRSSVGEFAPGSSEIKDAIYNITGFDTFFSYLLSDTVEVLTFYGDIYDEDSEKYLRNHVIKIVDRHKIIYKKPDQSLFGSSPIYHVGWRIVPGNLWAMGPLENLVGMQYRLDHLENMKADVFDLTAYPPIKIKGYIDDFTWGPFERIYVGDEGDVELMSPDVQALNANTEILMLERKMEEMAGSPREAMGFRTPGEKTKYEVQSLENASARIFMNKIAQFERHMVEPLLNAMLELARRNLRGSSKIRGISTDTKTAVFKTITPEDIIGQGSIRPFAARHFTEVAQTLQELSSFYSSALAQDQEIRMHFSSVKIAQMIEELLELGKYKVVLPYVRLSEQGEAALMQQSIQEDVQRSAQTPTGILPGDHDPEVAQDAFNALDQASRA